MMGWAFSGNKKQAASQEDGDGQPTGEEKEGESLDEKEVQGINLGETELPRKAEPYSREMYEELEQRV